MLPLLQKSAARGSGGLRVSRAAVLNMSSMAGSITRAGVEFTQDLVVPAYKISKVSIPISLNKIAKSVSSVYTNIIKKKCLCVRL